MERHRSHVLVAVTPRLLGDSLSLALDCAGDWDIVHVDDVHDLDASDGQVLDAAIITTDHRAGLIADIVIELPDADNPSRYGYVEIGGRRHRADVGTIDAIIDLLRAEGDVNRSRRPGATLRDEPSPPRPAAN